MGVYSVPPDCILDIYMVVGRNGKRGWSKKDKGRHAAKKELVPPLG